MMPFNFLLIFALLNLAFAGNHATLTKEELYWNSVFPNNPMPNDLHDILPRHGRSTNKDDDPRPETFLPFTWYGDINYYNLNYRYNIWDLYDQDYNDYDYEDHYIDLNYNNGDYNGDYWYRANDNYAPAPAGNDFGGQNHALAPSNKFRGHNHAASNNKGVNDSASGNRDSPRRQSNYIDVSTINETLYFFQEALHPGEKMNLPRLVVKSDKTLFLPQEIAESMPIKKDKVQEILKTFSLKDKSRYAHDIRRVIGSCERAAMKGEEKYCATSIESFIDLSVSMFGKSIKLLTHQIGKGLKNPLFTIRKGIRDMGDKNIVCHKMTYPYAIYLCHFIKNTTLYQVPLVSMDGTKANGLAVCHKDTAGWSSRHISFQFLKVKPGSVPICHFVSRDTVIWVSN